ncbi:amino acid ABC transporter permease [Vibrio litoralis]|uniref:amino acid ABC transporter permease n=1 Tax=Vibrio litoralis TaxID=335972 RepID=UPI000EDD3985|nr:amino acid ABC transporter permease [Vibrio litoralis]HCH49557.1 amino acid ABC transporter permease [Proteus sp. (in: enterobacteria)]
MDIELILHYLPLLLLGLKVTVYSCLIALIIGLVIGVFIYQISNSRYVILRYIYHAYITIFRGTPLLVQVYLLYYGGPMFGLNLEAVEVGILGMGFYVSAYFSEIYRAGFNSILKGQIEAAYDLGLSKFQMLIHIQLPQMLGLIIPPITNQSIILIKESAILSIITVPEITTAAVKMATETFSVVEPYILLALAYWTITYCVGKFGQWIETKTTKYLSVNQNKQERAFA